MTGACSSSDRDALLDKEGADLIDCRGPPRDQARANAMASPKIKLILHLHAHGISNPAVKEPRGTCQLPRRSMSGERPATNSPWSTPVGVWLSWLSRVRDAPT